MLTKVASPCKSQCCLDADRTYCISCGRTLQEIASWQRMSDTERKAVVTRLAKNLY